VSYIKHTVAFFGGTVKTIHIDPQSPDMQGDIWYPITGQMMIVKEGVFPLDFQSCGINLVKL
jgi:hypothetical protein